MSKITAGEVAITLAEEERVLRPTLNAATRINNHFGGFVTAIQRVQAMDLDACAYVIRQGLGLSDAEAKELKAKVWSTGVIDLMAPIAKYLMILANGGRDSSSEEAGGEDREAPGKE